jgi:lysine-N-methylase
VLASYGALDRSLEPPVAWGLLVERRARLEAVHGARVAQYFHHYTVNHWLRHSTVGAPGVLAYVFRLALRVALLRFTLLGHPEVVALCAEAPAQSPEEAQARLDRAAVECFQLMGRHVEQASEFLELADGLTGTEGEEALGRSLVFAKFFEAAGPRPG